MPAHPPVPLYIKPSFCVAFHSVCVHTHAYAYIYYIYRVSARWLFMEARGICRELGSTIETENIRKLLPLEKSLGRLGFWRKWLTEFSLSNP